MGLDLDLDAPPLFAPPLFGREARSKSIQSLSASDSDGEYSALGSPRRAVGSGSGSVIGSALGSPVGTPTLSPERFLRQFQDAQHAPSSASAGAAGASSPSFLFPLEARFGRPLQQHQQQQQQQQQQQVSAMKVRTCL
jgi:hypothetical protein